MRNVWGIQWECQFKQWEYRTKQLKKNEWAK